MTSRIGNMRIISLGQSDWFTSLVLRTAMHISLIRSALADLTVCKGERYVCLSIIHRAT